MEIIRQCMILRSVLSTTQIQHKDQWMLLRAIVERLPVVKASTMKGCFQMLTSAPSSAKRQGEKNLAPRKLPVDIPSIHESSCSEEVDDSEDKVVRPVSSRLLHTPVVHLDPYILCPPGPYTCR